ncbi:MAG: T9SS type A sorting domain-containing protein [Flavobacteriales bacterium]
MRFLIVSFICLLAVTHCNAQNKTLTWKDHFSYRKVKHVTATSNAVYAATELGAYKVDLSDNSITRINKTNKLSDTGISFMEGVPDKNMVIIGYTNGNVDILIDDRPLNLSDIKNSSIIAAKGVNEILVDGDFAYVCTEFGIVQIDLIRLEIKDTFLIGNNGAFVNVLDMERLGDTFVVATPSGLMQANANNAFLSNFTSWSTIEGIPNAGGTYKNLSLFNGLLFANTTSALGEFIYTTTDVSSGVWEEYWFSEVEEVRDIRGFSDLFIVTAKGKTIEFDANSNTPVREIPFLGTTFTDNFQTTVSPDGDGIWIANQQSGLFHVTDFSGIQEVSPNGPENSEARRINSYFENVWVSTGGVSLGFANNFTQNGINYYLNNRWGSLTRFNEPALLGENEFGGVAFDIMDVTIDPINNSRVFASSWDEGVFEIINEEIVETFNASNSTLNGGEGENADIVRVDGVVFDEDNNLWVSNSFTSECLHVYTANGEWIGFDFSPDINETFKVSELLVDRNNYIWGVLPNNNGVLVFDYNETLADKSDDRYRILTAEEGNGALASDDVYSIAQDVNGEIWIGTLQGISVFYNTECLFTDEECDSQQILIEQDGNFQLLLETETITSIEIDGGNRKWIGTQTSGAYLLSSDGIDQIERFTTDNSPLLSDNIQDISFNFTTGEIFFATDLGIVSYTGTATGFDGEIKETSIYPNPVRENYNGPITIDGFTFQTDIKITDINGNLVYQTVSEGGRAIWDATSENGNRVSTGVYLVFATTDDGEETTVGKIAVVN